MATGDEVMYAVDRVVDCVTALEPMTEVLVEAGVSVPLVQSGAALLCMAMTGELLRERSLAAYAKLRGLDGAPDAERLGPDREVLAAARKLVRDAIDLGVIGPVEGGDVS